MLDYGEGYVMNNGNSELLKLGDDMAARPSQYIAIQVTNMYESGDKQYPVTVKFKYAGAVSEWENFLIEPRVLKMLEVGGWYVIRVEWIKVRKSWYKKWFSMKLAGYDEEVVTLLGAACREWHESGKKYHPGL